MSLVARAVRKRYGGRAALTAVDLELADGTIALVTGSNGAGKSTLLRCLAGITRHEGTVRHSAGLVAYLPQGAVLPAAATVGEVLGLFGARAGVPDGWIRVAQERRIGDLSGGERKRVAIAALLSLGARVVLADEAYADLDAPGARLLSRWLLELRDSGATVVVSAPDRSRVADLPHDRIVELDRGTVVGDRAA